MLKRCCRRGGRFLLRKDRIFGKSIFVRKINIVVPEVNIVVPRINNIVHIELDFRGTMQTVRL